MRLRYLHCVFRPDQLSVWDKIIQLHHVSHFNFSINKNRFVGCRRLYELEIMKTSHRIGRGSAEKSNSTKNSYHHNFLLLLLQKKFLNEEIAFSKKMKNCPPVMGILLCAWLKSLKRRCCMWKWTTKNTNKITCGTAKIIDKIQIPRMNLIALDSFDIVWDKNGWQIPIYLKR